MQANAQNRYNGIGLQLQIHGKYKIGWGRKLGVGGMVGFEIRPGFMFRLEIACKQKKYIA